MGAIDKLKRIMVPAPSNWREKAEWRRNNREWLRVSGRIAVIIMENNQGRNKARKYVMDKLGCDARTASGILKGSHDFKLSEISRLVPNLDLNKIGKL